MEAVFFRDTILPALYTTTLPTILPRYIWLDRTPGLKTRHPVQKGTRSGIFFPPLYLSSQMGYMFLLFF